MQLKPLKIKSKEYIFKVFGNSTCDNPAKVVFYRFPFQDEAFPVAEQKSIVDSSFMKEFDNTAKAKEKLVEHIIDVMITNLTANRINYQKFLYDCVDHFENFEYENKKINSVDDFIKIVPQEAVFLIAQELFLYSKETDEFSIEEKKS